MNITIINIGSELMEGSRLNTHHQWIARRLLERGYALTRQVSILDAGSDIREAVAEALEVADVVITTGGLGPTSDDVTREYVAALLGRELHRDDAVLAHIESFFSLRRKTTPERVKVQALVPEGAVILHNAFGTAPGLAFRLEPNPFREGQPAALFMLPGPPRELYPMFDTELLPRLQKWFPTERPFQSRNLRTTGLGESAIEEAIHEWLVPLVADGLEVAYCLSPGSVDVRLSAHGADAVARIDRGEAIVREALGASVFAVGEEDLETVLVKQLTRAGRTLATAESCTGGLIANRVTNVPGASAIFLAGLVTYSNEAKMKFLGVRAETLELYGAVSRETALEMAEGARRATGADLAVSVTGIAGPGGGSTVKPVGTVYVGVASAEGTKVRGFLNPYDRETFKVVTSQQALDLVRQALAAE